MPLVYKELRDIARRYLRKEKPGHTLQGTALVHEAYLRLVDQSRTDWKSRAHFYGVAATIIRNILVDHARGRQAGKRGGAMSSISLDDAVAIPRKRDRELIAVDDALLNLSQFDPQQSRIVELRFFGGLTIEETSEVLGISESTVKRDWILAETWIGRHDLRAGVSRMTADRWERVKALFERARHTSGGDLALLLAEDDEDITAEVKALLDAYNASPEFLEEPALASRSGDVVDEDSPSLAGSRIGNWRLTRQIGEGGMGIVYECDRADGEFEQRAAMKILKRWMAGETDVARFRAERQILAGLDHPGIARLLDGGATADGLPYYAMEFVSGQLIDEFCSRRKLGIRERLELLRKVCGAVAYAHGRGIVHRDLKPSNILVTENGAPKLLDFGIAKVLDDSGNAEAKTLTLQRMATPRYASPEQLDGGPITPASDVYSLGVVLSELLTGQRGSTKDLGYVVRKAMERDPAERYPSGRSSPKT